MKNNYNLDHNVDPSADCIKYIKAHYERSFSQHFYDDMIVRGNLCPVLISILFNTNNYRESINTIKKFVSKSKNPEKLQFCIKIDNESEQTEFFLKSLAEINSNFIILCSPKGRGYIDLWQWVNFLYKVSSKRASYVLNISDEMTVNEKNWDIRLEKYLTVEEDGIFRLRTSVYKNRNYSNLQECAYAPDTTAIYTRKYLNIQGSFSPCFGPDNGQQFVAYYLSKLNYPRHYQFSRDKVINDISFSGQGTNIGVKNEKLYQRQVINYLLWLNMFKKKFQEDYFHRARKIQLEIIRPIIDNYDVKHYETQSRYSMKIYDYDRKRYCNLSLSYKINFFKNFFYNITKIDFYKYQTAYDMPKIMGIAIHLFIKYVKVHPKSLTKKNKEKRIIISYLRKIWVYISKNHKILEKYNFIFPVKIILLFLVFFDIKGFILFLIYFSLKILSLPILIFLDPKLIIYKIDYLYKRSSSRSNIISQNNYDQSKTIIVKGD